ncbi:MAG TPA: hypothetical protein VEH50_14780 [Methylomirabilota bacterium]|nr:hypothetical protein [Methylomirabilota bacterium]
MSFFERLRVAGVRHSAAHVPRAIQPANATAAPGIPMAPPMRVPVQPASDALHSSRISNGLKEFLWYLDGVGRGCLLDLGPVWQQTVGFFVDRGFKVYSEDLLGEWKEFLEQETEKCRADPQGDSDLDRRPPARAERFMETALRQPAGTLDAVLLWDLLDYLDPALVERIVARLLLLVREGGVVLAMFHSRTPEGFRRYRVLDGHSLEVLSTHGEFPHLHVYQNREILNLFGRFHSSKSFVGRDQIREGLFIK